MARTRTREAPTAGHAPPTAGEIERRLIDWGLQRDPDATPAAARTALDQAEARARDQAERGADPLQLRELFRRSREASARLKVVESLLAGAEPSWESLTATIETEVAAELLTARVGGAHGTLRLVAQVETWTDADRAELAGLEAELAGLEVWSIFDPNERVKHVRALTLARRIEVREAALSGFRARFAEELKALIEANRGALESGLVEVHRLSERVAPPAEIAAAEGELTEVRRQLDLVVGGSIAPGPRSTRLRQEEESLAGRIDQLRSAHVTAIEAEVRDLIDRAAGPDPDGHVLLADTVAIHADAFPAGLAAGLHGLGAEAMIASDPRTWAGALVGYAAHGGRGREFE